jgi:hypothetical protein
VDARLNGKHHLEVGFEVLTAVSTKMAVFWVVAPCSLAEVYQRFRGPCCLHHQGESLPFGRLRRKSLKWNLEQQVVKV